MERLKNKIKGDENPVEVTLETFKLPIGLGGPLTALSRPLRSWTLLEVEPSLSRNFDLQLEIKYLTNNNYYVFFNSVSEAKWSQNMEQLKHDYCLWIH